MSRMRSENLLLADLANDFSGFQNHFHRMRNKNLALKLLKSKTNFIFKWSCEPVNQVPSTHFSRKDKFITLSWHLMVVTITIVSAPNIHQNQQVSAALNPLLQIQALQSNLNPAFGGIDATRAIEKLSPFHNLAPDAFLDPPEFIRSRHFVPETHYVETKDHYILTLHRIINPLVPNHLRSRLKPVLLQHGLFTSSFNFLISSDRNNDRPRFDARDLLRTRPLNFHIPEPPFSWQRFLETFNDITYAKLGFTKSSDRLMAPHISESMAFEMANQGYDVWMGNSRGSTYSLNHTRLDYRYDWRYWDFSFHEIGLFDLPASIDYILSKTKRRSLAYIGHSQGNLAMFILQSFHPEWALKVKPFIAMAPIAFIPDIYYGIVRVILRLISPVLTPRGLNNMIKGQILPKSPLTEQSLDLVCVPKWTTPICNIMLSLMTGNSLKRANSSLTPIVAHHIPEGTSVLNVLHFGQLVESGEFRSFDFGPVENQRRYGTPVNPYYPIKNIRSPDIAFVVGRTDRLSTMTNVAITRSMLSVPLMDDYVVPDLVWGHADYMYAIGAGRIANSHMINLCDRYRLVP